MLSVFFFHFFNIRACDGLFLQTTLRHAIWCLPHAKETRTRSSGETLSKNPFKIQSIVPSPFIHIQPPLSSLSVAPQFKRCTHKAWLPGNRHRLTKLHVWYAATSRQASVPKWTRGTHTSTWWNIEHFVESAPLASTVQTVTGRCRVQKDTITQWSTSFTFHIAQRAFVVPKEKKKHWGIAIDIFLLHYQASQRVSQLAQRFKDRFCSLWATHTSCNGCYTTGGGYPFCHERASDGERECGGGAPAAAVATVQGSTQNKKQKNEENGRPHEMKSRLIICCNVKLCNAFCRYYGG